MRVTAELLSGCGLLAGGRFMRCSRQLGEVWALKDTYGIPPLGDLELINVLLLSFSFPPRSKMALKTNIFLERYTSALPH